MEGIGTAAAQRPVPESIVGTWRGFLGTLAEIAAVPAALIVRLDGPGFELLATPDGRDQPVTPAAAAFCRRAATGGRDGLAVGDGLGLPIHWPDGSLFGALCALAPAAGAWPAPVRRLAGQFRAMVEEHLANLGAPGAGEHDGFEEERYRLLVDNSADEFILHDASGRILDANRIAFENKGYSREDLLALRVSDFSATLGQADLEQIWAVAQPGASFTAYNTQRRRDGTTYPVEARVSCLMVRGQKLFFAMARDMTERAEADRRLRRLNAELEQRVTERALQWRKSSELLQTVMDGATDGIFMKDRDGRFLFFNEAAARFIGRGLREMLGRDATQLYDPATGLAIRRAEEQVVDSGEPVTVEETYTINGATRTFLTTRTPQRNERGEVVGLIGIARDITERKRELEALRDGQARWQFAIDGTGDGIWDWDLETGRVFFSTGWKAMLGHGPDEIGDTVEEWSTRVHPDDLDRCWQVVEHHFKSQTADFVIEHRMRAKDGSWKWVLDRGRAIRRAPDGRPLRVIGTHTDITARRAAEEELRVERERLTLAAEASRIGIWDVDLESGTAVYDARWHEIFATEPGRMHAGRDVFWSRIHPDDAERIARLDRQALEAGSKTVQSDFRIILPSGEERFIASSACLIGGEGQAPRRIVGIVMDVTESRAAEVRLQRSYEALRQAERLAQIGSWTLDFATGRFSGSDMFHEMTGVAPVTRALMPSDLPALLAPDHREEIGAAVARCLAEGEPWGIEIRRGRPDGSRLIAHLRGQANRDAVGTIVGLSGTLQDVTEREEARARLAALADNLPNGAIYRLEHKADGRFGLTYVSGGIQAILGVPAAEIVADRRTLLSTIHVDDLDRYQEAVAASLARREVFDCEFRAWRRDGRMIWMHCRSAPRVQPDGTTAWDGIMWDITRERQAAQALREAKEAAEAAESAKSDFLATMSHEIRTPMNTVIGMTRLALQTGLAPKQRNYLEKIDASAKMLLSIINDVLDFSKIGAGKLELEDTEFTLESVLETVSAVVAMRAEEKGLEIAYRIAPQTPRHLRGDPLRLGQILTNLIGNAVKFTAQGEVVVSIEHAGEDQLRFAVRDTGIGLDSGQIARLFQPFAQAQAQTSRRYGGTGLGLAICRQLVEAMGGRIWVESAPGRGSTFSFTIRAGRPQESAPLRSAHLEGRRVLIVDDNASARDILSAMVRSFGLIPTTVESGARAITALRAAAARGTPYDIVLMDWRMPVMDGLETARRIRADAALPDMPAVLMVTAYGREEVLRSAERLGLQGVLIKPITESVMFNTILDILAPPGAMPARGDAAPATAEDPLSRPEAGLAALAGRRVLVVDDNALNREVAGDFLAAAGMAVDTAVNGVDALSQMERRAYDVVLMDMHMPEMDGLSTARAIRREARWATLPIIALTAQARVEDRSASLAAGMTAHLTKPIDEAALYRTLLEVLAPGAEPDGIGTGPVEPAAATAAIDLTAALRRLGGNAARLERLLQGFLRDFADAPTRLDEHLQTGDADAIATLAHKVKGTAGYLDAHAACAAAEALEEAARQGDDTAMRRRAPLFRERLEAVLGLVADGLADPAEGGTAGPFDPDAVLALVAQAEPLIEHGDYAAQPLLEQVCRSLAGRPAGRLALEARTYYEELELDAAGAVLRQLKASLREEGKALP